MNAQIFQDLESGSWNLPNPSQCLCHGMGWLLSDFDTWHRCHIHGRGVPHPEDDAGAEAFDSQEHLRLMCRKAFAMFREMSGLSNQAFQLEAAFRLARPPSEATPQDWVNAAEAVLTEKDQP